MNSQNLRPINKLSRAVIGLLLTFLFLCLNMYSFAQDNSMEVSRKIEIKNLEHPYLLFDNAAKEDMKERIASDRKLTELLEKQLILAERNLKLPVKTDLSLPLERSRIYDRGEVFTTLSSYREAAQNLAFAYQFTNNTAYAEKSFEYAEMICKLDSWVYSFHKFNNIYSRVWPWNVDDDQVVFSFDLQSARTANALSLIYDWLYPALTKSQRDRLRGALLENAITRVRGNYEYHWWATAYRCNWCGICHSGVGIAALALLKEDPHLLDIVDKSYTGVYKMFDEIGVDGGWQEGRGYWAYGLSHSFVFAEAVKRLTNDKYNLFAHEKMNPNPADFPLYTLGSSFGDGRGNPVGNSWFLNKIIAESGSRTAAFYKKEYIRDDESWLDIIWPETDVEALEPEVKSKHFRGIDWAVLQNDFFSDESFSIICKAGMNDDPHHGHLDCGQFILNYKGKPFIRELHHPVYDDYYFSEERWDYYTASSKGHNVVHVNGEQQIIAKLKDQGWKDNVGGEIVEFNTSEKKDYVLMNLTHAYPGEELKHWQRHILYVKPDMALVLDDIGSEKGAEITSRIHPGGSVEMKGGYFTIEIENEKMMVVPFGDAAFRIENGRDVSLSVKEKNNFEWMPYTEMITTAVSEKTYLGWLILPFSEGMTKFSVEIDNSSPDGVTVSLKNDEFIYDYTF